MPKYGKKASEKVEKAMHERKKGTLKSGRSGRKVKSRKQAIAIGLSKARRAGVKLPIPKKGTVPEDTRRKAKRDAEAARTGRARRTSRKRSRATLQALKREPRSTVSKSALAKQARTAARRRTARSRSASAKKAARTRRATAKS